MLPEHLLRLQLDLFINNVAACSPLTSVGIESSYILITDLSMSQSSAMACG